MLRSRVDPGREYPRLVAIETTSRCNARCAFCPNSALQRGREAMSDELFEKVVEDCRAFPLQAIEPFLNGEPFMDPKILPRLQHIRRRLPEAKLRLYTNAHAMTPKKIDQLVGLGIDHLYVSLNTMVPEKYLATVGLRLERTLRNLDYLTEPVRRSRVAEHITFRITRLADTPLSEQEDFLAYCKRRGVKPFIVGLFNYKGDVSSDLPVPGYPCEHITRLDILSSGIVTLCCMDQEGEFAWGDTTRESVLEIHNGPVARRFREMHRSGQRLGIAPCGTCNLFWPSLEKMPLLQTARFGIEAGWYFLRHRPTGKRRPIHSARD